MVKTKGLTGKLYEIKVLPNTATQLAEAILTQKELTKEEIMDMAGYLDKRYNMSDYVPKTPPQTDER